VSMPNVNIDYYDSSTVAIQVNGSDVAHLEFDTESEEWIHVRVYKGTHPDAGIVFEDYITWDINDRSRNEED
jgi:hypothetical protein